MILLFYYQYQTFHQFYINTYFFQIFSRVRLYSSGLMMIIVIIFPIFLQFFNKNQFQFFHEFSRVWIYLSGFIIDIMIIIITMIYPIFHHFFNKNHFQQFFLTFRRVRIYSFTIIIMIIIYPHLIKLVLPLIGSTKFEKISIINYPFLLINPNYLVFEVDWVKSSFIKIIITNFLTLINRKNFLISFLLY